MRLMILAEGPARLSWLSNAHVVLRRSPRTVACLVTVSHPADTSAPRSSASFEACFAFALFLFGRMDSRSRVNEKQGSRFIRANVGRECGRFLISRKVDPQKNDCSKQRVNFVRLRRSGRGTCSRASAMSASEGKAAGGSRRRHFRLPSMRCAIELMLVFRRACPLVAHLGLMDLHKFLLPTNREAALFGGEGDERPRCSLWAALRAPTQFSQAIVCLLEQGEAVNCTKVQMAESRVTDSAGLAGSSSPLATFELAAGRVQTYFLVKYPEGQ
jgi:hypothetical protein